MTPAGPIFVVDDDPGQRRSIRAVLESHGFTVADFGSGEQFLNEADLKKGGCILLDLKLPSMDGLEVQERLSRFPECVVVFMSGLVSVPQAVQAMQMGAADVLQKPIGSERLIGAVARALERSRSIRAKRIWLAEAARRLERLSARERQIVDSLVRGMQSKRIAAEFGISKRTVDIHRANIMRKLEVRSMSELVRIVLGVSETEE